MPFQNILSLHEAIVVALININPETRSATFQQIAHFIDERKLFVKRKGNIPLTTQVMLRSTKAKGAYYHLFETVNDNAIRLRNILSIK